MTINYQTPAEKARDEKHKAICNDYLAIVNQLHGVSTHRIFRILADRYDMTTQGVRQVVIRAGLYSPKKS